MLGAILAGIVAGSSHQIFVNYLQFSPDWSFTMGAITAFVIVIFGEKLK